MTIPISPAIEALTEELLPAGWHTMDKFPDRTKFGPLIDFPQFFGVDEATCIVYEFDEGEAIGLVRAKLNHDEHQWEPYAWMPIERWGTEVRPAVSAALIELRAENEKLREALGYVAEAFKKLGPTGYFPSMGATLSDKIRNAVADYYPEVNKVVGTSFDRKALTPDGEKLCSSDQL